MKKLLLFLTIFKSLSCLAIPDVKIAEAVFSNEDFQVLIGKEKIESIEITQTESHLYELVANSKAPLVDGCSYSATVFASEERFAIDPLTTGVRTVLSVKHVSSKCG